MPDHTTDTHALVWYLTGSQLLSVTAKRIFDNVVNGSGQIYIPAIVLAEMVMIIEKRRVVMDLPHMIAIMRNYTGFLFTSLSPQIASNLVQTVW
jgi:predicted nucleic acid-binding protein